MERVTINTGLDHFMALESITHADLGFISGTCGFNSAPAFFLVEACAQICAFHVRYLKCFNCHAFLLKIKSFSMPYKERVTGRYLLNANVTGRSDRAFSFTVTMEDEQSEVTNGEFIIAVKEYNFQFDEKRFKEHYEKVFSCLKSASKTD